MVASLVGPAWVMAQVQADGRGRRGRSWVDPAGNFAATYIARFELAPAKAGQLSFVAALALHDALSQLLTTAADLSIKWPNDILLNGAKVAGILLESRSAADGSVGAVAIGFGVNLIAAPPDSALDANALQAVCVLGETGLTLSQDQMLDTLAICLGLRLTQMHDEGFEAIRQAWLSFAARLGETVTARTGTATHIGRFDGIDPSGALILMSEAGRQTIPAADIFF